MTKRLAESVSRLCAVMSIRHVADYFGLNWKTVKNIDKRSLERRLGPVDLKGVTVIGMDEFAIQRGHRYATVVIEPSRKRVLWVGRERSREGMRPFFTLLGPEGCAALEAVVMDMNGAFEQEVRAQAPQAQIVYDLFHVVAKYGREVIDRLRVVEANRLRADSHARRLAKGSRWLLLRNRENVTREADQVRLRELLTANRALMIAYVLKDDLKELWNYRHEGYVRRFWLGWYRRATRSHIEPLTLVLPRVILLPSASSAILPDHPIFPSRADLVVNRNAVGESAAGRRQKCRADRSEMMTHAVTVRSCVRSFIS